PTHITTAATGVPPGAVRLGAAPGRPGRAAEKRHPLRYGRKPEKGSPPAPAGNENRPQLRSGTCLRVRMAMEPSRAFGAGILRNPARGCQVRVLLRALPHEVTALPVLGSARPRHAPPPRDPAGPPRGASPHP